MLTEIKQRPILFSTPMAQAILEGRKTMTRRKLKVQPYPPRAIYSDSDAIPILKENGGDLLLRFNWKTEKYFPKIFQDASFFEGKCHCPYGKVGDVLWVRENYYQYGKWGNNGQTKTGKRKRKFIPLEEEILFSDTEEALGETFHLEMGDRSTDIPGWFKRLGRFMSKKYARTFLRITDIRVERLQDISEEDAVAEGILPVHSFESGCGISNRQYYENYLPVGYTEVLPIDSFRSLWESINGAESWEANQWVWVISFERINKTE